MAADTTVEAYPWYEVVPPEAGLQQGDFFKKFLVVVPNLQGLVLEETTKNVPVKILEFDVVILSQSCDLEVRSDGKGKVETVILCPVVPFSEAEAANPTFKRDVIREGLKQGLLVGFHLLNDSNIPGFEHTLAIVDFRNTFQMPFDYMLRHASNYGPRLRLRSPYSEYLGQGFGRHMMRVALPVPLRIETKK